jgi:two-component system chemotaxis response regulator CheB
MGSDGAAGLAALKEAGATTIVQSPETCVVAGMPQAAITAGVVDRIGSIPEIGEWLRTAIRAGRERARR